MEQWKLTEESMPKKIKENNIFELHSLFIIVCSFTVYFTTWSISTNYRRVHYMVLDPLEVGVALAICPAYLVLANIQNKQESLPRTSTFYCILALARAAPHTLGNLCPSMWSCSFRPLLSTIF